MTKQTIQLEGYGKLKGSLETVTVLRQEGGNVILAFSEENGIYEVPFRLTDGKTVGPSPDGGYRIPALSLAQFKREGIKQVATKTANKAGTASKAPARKKAATPAPEVVTAEVTATEGEVPESSGDKAATKAKAATKTAPATNGAKTPAPASKRAPKATPAPVEPDEEEEEETEAPVKPAATKTSRAAGSKPDAANKPATKAKETAQPVSEEELSPMLAEGRTRRVLKEGEKEIKLTPLMYRQIAWDELKPYPTPPGRPGVAGFADFRRAMSDVKERNYIYMVVNAKSAAYLVNTVLVNGFKAKWQGPLTAGFKQVAKRLAEELAEAYGFPVPKLIAEHTVTAPVVTPGKKRGRPSKEELAKREAAAKRAEERAAAKAAGTSTTKPAGKAGVPVRRLVAAPKKG